MVSLAGELNHKVARTSDTSEDKKPVVSLNVLDFGAIGDGTTKNTTAIQQAIDRCNILAAAK